MLIRAATVTLISESCCGDTGWRPVIDAFLLTEVQGHLFNFFILLFSQLLSLAAGALPNLPLPVDGLLQPVTNVLPFGYASCRAFQTIKTCFPPPIKIPLSSLSNSQCNPGLPFSNCSEVLLTCTEQPQMAQRNIMTSCGCRKVNRLKFCRFCRP